MSVPTELLGKQLIGSKWRRRIGKHSGTQIVITSTNDAGAKFSLVTRTANGGKSHVGDKRMGSAQWPLFTTLYEPEGILQDMIVTVDKEGYVQAVEKEGVKAVTQEMPEPMRLCTGAWHRKGGTGTMLPVSHFSINARTGELAKTCNSCNAKRKAIYYRESVKNSRVPVASVKAIIEPEVVAAVPITTPVVEVVHLPQSMHRWKVVIVKRTEVIVEGSDFLDAASAAGDGEIISVERL